MKRIISLLLVLLMVLSLTACRKTPAIQTTQVDEPAPTAAPTAVPTATPEPLPPENWADIDREFFKEYLSSDITSLHQLVKDPAKYGIDYDEVERSLGTYREDPDREWYVFVENTLSRMDRVDQNALTPQEKLAYDTLRQYCELELEGEAFYGYYEPLSPYTGIQVDLPLVFWFYDLNSKQDVEDYFTLLADVPRFFSELLEYEQYRAEKLGIFMIEANLNRVIEDLDKIIDAKDTIFLIPLFMESIAKVEGLTDTEIDAYQERNVSLLTNEFHQAYVDLKAGLEALRPYCREAKGVKEMNNDTYYRWYQYQLKISCADTQSPDDISKLLKDSYRDCYSNARQAMQLNGKYPSKFSLGTVEENVEFLRKTLDPWLPALPEVNVTYEEVADELKDIASPAFYLIPAFDDWQNNKIGLNQPQEARNLLSTLAHEGFNGHLYQYVYHRSMPGLSLSQQLIEPTAYAEAWSQFSEYLLARKAGTKIRVYDMQTYQGFEQMATEMLGYLCVRVNYFGDSFNQAYDLFGSYFNYSKEEFRDEIYDPFIIGHPFYYMPYAYGYARLINLMALSRRTMGNDKFDEKAFYAQYLSYGPSFFNLLADRLDAWAQAQ